MLPPDTRLMRLIQQPLAGRRLVVLTVLLGGFTAFGPLSMDLYLPAFPELAADLGVSQAAVQLTLTADVIGLVVGQLVLGPLSDAHGPAGCSSARRWSARSRRCCARWRRRRAGSPRGASCRARPGAAGSCWPARWPPTLPAGWRRPGCSRCS